MQGSVERSVEHPVDCPAAEEMARQGLLATGTDGAMPFSHPVIPTGAFGPANAERRDSGISDHSTLFDSSSSLRAAAAARVAAHRSRRAGAQTMEAAREEALRSQELEARAQMERIGRRGVSRVRDAVRARYEHSQSYRDFLAAEAERATQQARAEAEIAARNARAIADAQLQLLEELKQAEIAPSDRGTISFPGDRDAPVAHPLLSDFQVEPERNPSPRTPETHSGELFADPYDELPVTEITSGGLTVRLYDDLGPRMMPTPPSMSSPCALADSSMTELEELDQEIAFRRAPEFIDHIIETLPLPANLIEFPRELVAARKARPRLAEGPLREDLTPEPQLRIFEVEPETISTEPAARDNIDDLAADAPVWQGLLLDTPAAAATYSEEDARTANALAGIAPISRRLMAAAVDACCIGAAFIGFATTVSYISGPRLQALSRPMLGAAVVVTLAIAALLYQLLFFSLNDTTPGMRYARIGLCTFADTSPTRRAMRRRVLASALAACPLGLGLLWAWLDDDRLGWHDRISRMYHRCY